MPTPAADQSPGEKSPFSAPSTAAALSLSTHQVVTVRAPRPTDGQPLSLQRVTRSGPEDSGRTKAHDAQTHALAHPEANSERFEGIEAKLEELRSYLY
jgi:hypothetical protein